MAEQANRDERLVPLALFSTTPEAEMVRELLSQNGIACVLQGGNFGALEPLPRQGGFLEIRLLVSQNELLRAQELYEAFFVSNDAALTEFLRPRNAPLLAYFKDNSDYDKHNDLYRSHGLPDLTGELHDLIAEIGLSATEVREESVYGWSVVASRNGVIFAWVGGSYDFFLRIREDRVDAACKDGARVDRTYPPEWLNFYVIRLGQDWREILKRWLRIAYEDALAISS
jgi:hypothetical protein